MKNYEAWGLEPLRKTIMKTINKNKSRSIEITIITIAIIILMVASFFAGIQICKLYNELKYFNFEYMDSINHGSDTSQEKGDSSDTSDELAEPDGILASIETTSTIGIITAYTTSLAEGTTCISASGKNVCVEYDNGEMLIACPPQLKIAKKIKDNGYVGFTKGTIVEVLGVQYECVDRMNAYHRSFDNHFDLYFGQGENAIKRAGLWGRRTLEVKVIDL